MADLTNGKEKRLNFREGGSAHETTKRSMFSSERERPGSDARRIRLWRGGEKEKEKAIVPPRHGRGGGGTLPMFSVPRRRKKVES